MKKPMRKIYIAGPLFTPAEVKQKKFEEEYLVRQMDLHGLSQKDYEIYNPINAPVNNKTLLPTAEDIFFLDEFHLMDSEIVFVDLNGEDPGTMVELGMIVSCENKDIYSNASDIRIGNAGSYDHVRVPWGMNQFVVGAIASRGDIIYPSFEESVDAFIKKELSLYSEK